MVDVVAPETAKRQVAYKVRISDVLNNPYRKEEGWLPNYIEVGSLRVSRVNIIGVIVSKQTGDGFTDSFVLDDGSARVPLRFFSAEDLISIGDVVLVVGRPREFGSERYIVPEIMKRVKEPRWADVRKKELLLAKHGAVRAQTGGVGSGQGVTLRRPVEDDGANDIIVETEDFTESPQSTILDIIRKQDAGSGVGFDEILVKSGIDDIDPLIKRLLENGDVFEVRPGRYKVLE